MLSTAGGQLRMGPMGPIGLDYSAVIQLGQLMGALDDPVAADLLSDLLPEVERAILMGLKQEE